MTTQTIFVTAGFTSKSVDISLVQNAASTAAGDPVLGLAFGTSGLQAYYRINGTGTLTSITLATQTATGTYSSGGFVQISSTNAPGQYRFDIPNACIASGGECNITFSGTPAGTAGNMETHTLKVIIYNFDLFSATAFTTALLTESYPALNAAPTLAQALLMIMQSSAPTSKVVSGTTETVTKLDGSTTAATFTLNSATNPSGIVRAT